MIGIGEMLRERSLESYREILDLGRHADAALRVWLEPAQYDDLLYRTYRVVTNHTPAILITEKFPCERYRA